MSLPFINYVRTYLVPCEASNSRGASSSTDACQKKPMEQPQQQPRPQTDAMDPQMLTQIMNDVDQVAPLPLKYVCMLLFI